MEAAPAREPAAPPQISLSLGNERIPTGDGSALSLCIKHSPKKARGMVLLIHGFAAEKTEGGLFDVLAGQLLALGWSVAAYDWRGLGESTGDFGGSPLRTHGRDLGAVLRRLERSTMAQRLPLVVVGFSLGAQLALRHARRKSVRALVHLSPAFRPSKSMWPRYNNSQLLSEVRSRGYFDKNGVRVGAPLLRSLRSTDSGAACLREIEIPQLVVHSRDDQRIPFGHVRDCVAGSDNPHVEFYAVRDYSHSYKPDRSSIATYVANWIHGLT